MNLEGVERTMLLTLFAKAKHSQQKNHKFYDSKAIEVISEVDYDFSIAEKDKPMQLGTISRTIVLDEMVGDYINAHPECTIVNIASGMDTRFNRLDNAKINWYNVDLKNSAEYRLKYIEDTDRVTTLAYSAMDPGWAGEIKIRKDVLFIIEGLTMYLNQKDVEDILTVIDENFDTCTVFVEIMPPISVKNAKEESIEDMNAKFIWGVEKGSDLRKLNPHFRWIKDVNLFDGVNVYKPHYRIVTWLPMLRKRMDYIAVLEK